MLCGQLMISSRPVIRYFAANLWSPVVLSFGTLQQTYDLLSTCHPMLCGQLMIFSRPVVLYLAANLWSPVVLSFVTLQPTYDLPSTCHPMLCGQLMISSRPVIRYFASYAVDKCYSVIQKANQLSLTNSLKAVNPIHSLSIWIHWPRYLRCSNATLYHYLNEKHS